MEVKNITLSKTTTELIKQLAEIELAERTIENLIGEIETGAGKFVQESDRKDISCSFLNIRSTLGNILQDAVRHNIRQTTTEDLLRGEITI